MPRQRSLTIAAICAVIATAIGIVISYLIHWFPAAASTQAKNTDTFYHVLVICSIPIFVLVVTVILYSVWQFRMRPGEEGKDGPPIHGNTAKDFPASTSASGPAFSTTPAISWPSVNGSDRPPVTSSFLSPPSAK